MAPVVNNENFAIWCLVLFIIYIVLTCIFVTAALYFMRKDWHAYSRKLSSIIIVILALIYFMHLIFLALLLFYGKTKVVTQTLHHGFCVLYPIPIILYVYNTINKCRMLFIQERKQRLYHIVQALLIAAAVLMIPRAVLEVVDALATLLFGYVEAINMIMYLDFFVILLIITLMRKWFSPAYFKKFELYYYGMLCTLLMITVLHAIAMHIYHTELENNRLENLILELFLDTFNDCFPLVGLRLFLLSSSQRDKFSNLLQNQPPPSALL